MALRLGEGWILIVARDVKLVYIDQLKSNARIYNFIRPLGNVD
jgi:hypothetical protein